MTTTDRTGIFGNPLPVVGMIHLPPLPGSPRYGGDMDALVEHAVADALTWIESGADGLMVENFGDVPFFKDRVPPITVAGFTAALTRVRLEVARRVPGARRGASERLVWGINVLRNDAEAALCIAAACGARFIRVNVHTGASVTDQGLVEGRAAETLRLRAQIHAAATGTGKGTGHAPIAIFADARVKHARPLVERPIAEEVADLVGRGGADAVLVTGERTGAPPTPAWIEEVRAASQAPLWIASGLTAANLRDYRGSIDGIIVGSAAKPDGRIGAPVDARRARAIVDAARSGGSGEAKRPRSSAAGATESGTRLPRRAPRKSRRDIAERPATLNVRVTSDRPSATPSATPSAKPSATPSHTKKAAHPAARKRAASRPRRKNTR